MTSARLLIASNSPRRRDLLAAAGFVFTTRSPEVDERVDADLTLREITALNATRKGLAVARAAPRNVVLAADTLVAFEGEVIGKPADLGEARRILRRLSGQTHEVCSGVFICHYALRRSVLLHEVSRVRFRALTDEAIASYFRKINPLDKAGAYGAQEEGAEIIEEIEGSVTNVIGLPMEKTVEALAGFGVRPVENP